MEVDVVNPSPTSILYRYGVGEPRVPVHANQDPEDPRGAIRWFSRSDHEARRGKERVLLSNDRSCLT
jgi:hypothetical protein